jgi:hypothetical protein
MLHAAATCFAIAILGLLAQIFYNLTLHPLSRVPGPRLAAISDLWRIKAAHSQKFLTRLREAHEKYGPVVRIAPNEISLVEPSEVKNLYGHKSEYLKGELSSAILVLQCSSFFTFPNLQHY